MRRPLAFLFSMSAIVMGALFTSAPAASATVNCGATYSLGTNEVSAHFTVACSGGKKRLSGWVEDTAGDDRAAYLYMAGNTASMWVDDTIATDEHYDGNRKNFSNVSVDDRRKICVAAWNNSSKKSSSNCH